MAHFLGDDERAARLFGAVTALRAGLGVSVRHVGRAQYESAFASMRAQLDDATFAAAWTQGQTMTLEQAIAYALADRGSE